MAATGNSKGLDTSLSRGLVAQKRNRNGHAYIQTDADVSSGAEARAALEAIQRFSVSALVDQLAQQGKSLPEHVHREFDAHLKCGRLEHGFLRVRCDNCHFERLVAFSCKKRGICPRCGARRMADTAALLADEACPDVPLRRWVISFPFPPAIPVCCPPSSDG